ncbi:MAG TPA: hypothetical protein VN039_02915 [Nitrospira sp.]|nr:hypothetical protein [Nitrospira sp.]
MKLRRRPVVQALGLWTMVAVFGLGFAIVGVQLHGLTTTAAVVTWLLAGAAIGGLATVLIAPVAGFEVEEEDSTSR